MNQANVKVSFYLKKSEADANGNCPVMAKLNIGKYSEAAFSVKMKVPQSRWASGRASGKSVAAKEINNRLDEIRAMALSIYSEQSAVRDGVTAEEVKSILLGMASEQETLLSYFKQFINNFEKRVGVNRTAKSLQAYRNTYRHIENFLQEKYRLTDIPFSALDRSFIDKYDLNLRTERHLAPGTDRPTENHRGRGHCGRHHYRLSVHGLRTDSSESGTKIPYRCGTATAHDHSASQADSLPCP